MLIPPVILALAANHIYTPEGFTQKVGPINFEFALINEFEIGNVIGGIFHDPTLQVKIICFRGTADSRDGYVDLKLLASFDAGGFTATTLQQVKAHTDKYVVPEEMTFVTGHSLGGARAQRFAHEYGVRGAAFNAPGAIATYHRTDIEFYVHNTVGDAVSELFKSNLFGTVIWHTPSKFTLDLITGAALIHSITTFLNDHFKKGCWDSYRECGINNNTWGASAAYWLSAPLSTAERAVLKIWASVLTLNPVNYIDPSARASVRRGIGNDLRNIYVGFGAILEPAIKRVESKINDWLTDSSTDPSRKIKKLLEELRAVIQDQTLLNSLNISLKLQLEACKKLKDNNLLDNDQITFLNAAAWGISIRSDLLYSRDEAINWQYQLEQLLEKFEQEYEKFNTKMNEAILRVDYPLANWYWNTVYLEIPEDLRTPFIWHMNVLSNPGSAEPVDVIRFINFLFDYGDSDVAANFLEARLAERPNIFYNMDSAELERIADYYKTVARYDLAKKYYKDVARRNPNNIDMQYNLAYIYDKLNRPNNAIDKAKRCIVLCRELQNSGEGICDSRKTEIEQFKQDCKTIIANNWRKIYTPLFTTRTILPLNTAVSVVLGYLWSAKAGGAYATLGVGPFAVSELRNRKPPKA